MSTSSKHRTFTATISEPFGAVPCANDPLNDLHLRENGAFEVFRVEVLPRTLGAASPRSNDHASPL
jgi:hypothetical protein